MGILQKDIEILGYLKNNGVCFDSTLMLGRQEYHGNLRYLDSFFGKEIILENTFAEAIFENFGSKKIDSMDYSSFEGANVIHDLNNPISLELKEKYDLIYDGGTLEHVFNFPQAMSNVINMLKIGGVFVGVSPANNYMGHGFYQFSPEIYYRIFNESNGCEMLNMFIRRSDKAGSPWYKIADPLILKKRCEIHSSVPLLLAVVARKKEMRDVFKESPQQSDYAPYWNNGIRIPRRRTLFPRIIGFFKKLIKKRKYIFGIGLIDAGVLSKAKF